MNGPEHYAHAEDLLEIATDAVRDANLAGAAASRQAAQVHATLALAAATAEPFTEHMLDDGDTCRRAWRLATS